MIHDIRKRNIVLLIFVVFLLFPSLPLLSEAADEAPVRVFDGSANAVKVLANLDYTDVKNSNTWAKPAIWETGALELMKGYGTKQFGLSDRLTVEQAIAIAYNMAGREAEAQLAAEALDMARREGEKKIVAQRMWSDGYLQLALNDGLITQEQYNDAFQRDQISLGPEDFHRNSSASREDMAFYIARVLGINPINAQTHLFNSFRDWQSANPHRIPYIEALLQNRVMNGDNQGYFSPKGIVTREQAAQIIQNAEPFLFSKLGMEKMKGVIQKIWTYTDKTNGSNSTVKLVNVRNSNGSLHQFRFTYPAVNGGTNEMTGDKNNPEVKGTIVNDMGVLKDEAALQEGQEISYIVRNGLVLYTTVIVNQKKTEYHLVKILSVDEQSRVIRSEMLLQLPFSDIRLVVPETLYNISSTGTDAALTVSQGALITIDFVQRTLKDIKPEALMMLTVENGLITVMEKVNMDLLQEEGIVSGILEENNPVLGYITLYFPDGSGTSPESARNLSNYRTYAYLRPEEVTIYKNGLNVAIEDLQPGDSVFIKLDDDGNLIRISGSDNYYPIYGRVLTKGNNTLQLEKEDGTVEQLHIPAGTPIYQDRRSVSWSNISEGDNLRILMQTSGNQVIIGEVVLQKYKPETNGIYRAQLGYYDSLSKSLVVSGLQQFKDGIWKAAEPRGIAKLPLHEKYRPDIAKGATGTVYIATSPNRMGTDSVIRLSVEDKALTTNVLNDTILDAQPGRGRLTLLNSGDIIRYGTDSLIVKGGKLLEPNQINGQDNAYLATSSLADGSRKANVVWLQEPATDTGLALLRGRISQIDALRSMTLESFSEFHSPKWEFMNIPKTLTIDPTVTRIFDDGGRADPAEFDDTGADSYKNRTVYVLAQDGKALLVSTAPYGDVVYKGRIGELSGTEKDAFGHPVAPPTSLVTTETMNFNPSSWLWENKPDTDMAFLQNTVFIKNGKIIDAGELEEGDRITVIQSTAGNNALVVLAESY